MQALEDSRPDSGVTADRRRRRAWCRYRQPPQSLAPRAFTHNGANGTAEWRAAPCDAARWRQNPERAKRRQPRHGAARPSRWRRKAVAARLEDRRSSVDAQSKIGSAIWPGGSAAIKSSTISPVMGWRQLGATSAKGRNTKARCDKRGWGNVGSPSPPAWTHAS